MSWAHELFDELAHAGPEHLDPAYVAEYDRKAGFDSRNALHHLPDFWKALALWRIAQMLGPGGILRLRDIAFAFDPSEAEAYARAWLDSASERADEGWTPGCSSRCSSGPGSRSRRRSTTRDASSRATSA